jgi:hypothetical protein
MRKLGFVVMGLLCTVGLLSMQASVSAKSKTVKDQITLSSDLKVGATLLKAGSYQVESDGKQITFQQLMRSVDDSAQIVNKHVKPVSVPCQTKALDKKSASTSLDTQADAAGAAVLRGLEIRGSDVAFTVSN